MKEKELNKIAVSTYQYWEQQGIRSDLNSVAHGPGKLQFRSAVFLLLCAFGCFFVGVLLAALQMRHVYLLDWDSQFLAPVFLLLFLLCMTAASYLIIVAKHRSNMHHFDVFSSVGEAYNGQVSELADT